MLLIGLHYKLVYSDCHQMTRVGEDMVYIPRGSSCTSMVAQFFDVFCTVLYYLTFPPIFEYIQYFRNRSYINYASAYEGVYFQEGYMYPKMRNTASKKVELHQIKYFLKASFMSSGYNIGEDDASAFFSLLHYLSNYS